MNASAGEMLRRNVAVPAVVPFPGKDNDPVPVPDPHLDGGQRYPKTGSPHEYRRRIVRGHIKPVRFSGRDERFHGEEYEVAGSK